MTARRIVVLVKEVPDTYGDRKLSLQTGLAEVQVAIEPETQQTRAGAAHDQRCALARIDHVARLQVGRMQ